MDECVWSIGGMILTGENWSTGRETLYSVGGRWMNVYGALVEWYWQRNTEVLREKPVTVHFADHKSDTDWSGIEHRLSRGRRLMAEPLDGGEARIMEQLSKKLFRNSQFWLTVHNYKRPIGYNAVYEWSHCVLWRANRYTAGSVILCVVHTVTGL
jgi:hypothetical protein